MDISCLENIFNGLEQFYLSQVQFGEYIAEINRHKGQSGVLNSRQYTYNYSDDLGYSPLNSHSHWNYDRLVGMAEYSAFLNGYYIQTRHNDYLLKSRSTGSSFAYIDSPNLPSDITGNVQTQIIKVKDYFKALNGEIPTNSVADFSGAFNWNLTYMECWWEYITGEQIEDPFDSDRHQIDAATIKDLIDKSMYFNMGGHKNQFENIPFFPVQIKDIDANGNPIICIFKYRIAAQPIGNLVDYPLDFLLSVRNDEYTKRRFALTNEEYVDTRYAKFRVNDFLGDYSPVNFRGPILLDELMSKIPGFDGAGSNLQEVYDQYNNDQVLKNYGESDVDLNAAYYNRFYSTTSPGASNRRDAKRGFTDNNLYVALTTDESVFGKTFGDKTYRFSYAIPLELVLDTFINKWNPYGVLDGDSGGLKPSDFVGKGNNESNPYPGFLRSKYFYKTPLELYDDPTDDEPASTGRKRWVACADNVNRELVPSGTPVFLPKMPGVKDRVRIRYPIYPVHEEGSNLFYRDEFVKGNILYNLY